MKKRKLALIFCLTLLLSVASPLAAFASDEETTTPESEEREPEPYCYIDHIVLSFDINSNGKTTDYCSAYVSDSSCAYTLTMRLQQKNSDGTWNIASPVKTWHTSGSGMVYLYENWYVLHGTYRISATVTVYDSQGLLGESVTEYSNSVTY